MKTFLRQVNKDFIIPSNNQKLPLKQKSVMPCPFTGPKMFWACPNFLCQTKNFFTYCGSHNHFVPENFCAGSKYLDQHNTFWDL